MKGRSVRLAFSLTALMLLCNCGAEVEGLGDGSAPKDCIATLPLDPSQPIDVKCASDSQGGEVEAAQSALGVTTVAILYQRKDGGGSRFEITVMGSGCSTHNIPALSEYGWNNRTSSIWTSGFCDAKLFSLNDYKGESFEYDNESREGGLYNIPKWFDNRASSVRIHSDL